jgi:hypothetical protein
MRSVSEAQTDAYVPNCTCVTGLGHVLEIPCIVELGNLITIDLKMDKYSV